MKSAVFLCLLWFAPLLAQTLEPVPPELLSLAALHDSMLEREKELLALQNNENNLSRREIATEITRVTEALNELRAQFQGIALSTDISAFDGEARPDFNLQREVEQLIQPLLSELKSATSDSREKENLKRLLAQQENRGESANKAIANLDRLLAAQPSEELNRRLSELRKDWQGRLRDANNQRTVLRQQIEQREAGEQSFIDRTRGAVASFIRTRGRNLTLGVLAFLIVFFSMRFFQNRIGRIKRTRRSAFASRLFNLIWNFASVILSLFAVMAVFNLAGDWFLLSLVLVFLIGVVWASIKTLPQFMEQIRMMLNIGAVREGGKLQYDGLSWKVQSITFATRLTNPLMEGSQLIIPTRLLVGMTSREPCPGEEWFPTHVQDWVVLSEGTFGQITCQNPSAVHIRRPGGALRIIPTPQFVEMTPVILSAGFRREFSFGIDYRHQAEATLAIPERMSKHLLAVLSAKLGEDLLTVRVEFAEAADSSLNMVVLIDCTGGAAPNYAWIPRWAQAALVDLCTQENWSIPFPQLQVHTQAPAEL